MSTDTDGMIDLDLIVDVVARVVAERHKSVTAPIEPDTSLEALHLDSLDIAEVFLALEDAVGQRLDPDSVGDVKLVRDLVAIRPLS